MRFHDLAMKAMGLIGRYLPFKAPQLVLLQAMAAAHDGRSQEAVERLEDLVGLSSEDYAENPRLSARLQACFAGMPQKTQIGILMALTGALEMEQRHDHGLGLLEADLGIHHSLVHLARKRGLAFYNAAHDPTASFSLIRAARQTHRRFVVATICGHGDFYRSGICLPVGGDAGEEELLWRGTGCDLSGIDWLWLVSCSLGRLRQNDDRDVAGFCVELALNRARAVAAYRWPVNAVEAALFTNSAVEHCVKLTDQERQREGGRRRAWALNAARRTFLDQSGPAEGFAAQPELNTIAACELYGAG